MRSLLALSLALACIACDTHPVVERTGADPVVGYRETELAMNAAIAEARSHYPRFLQAMRSEPSDSSRVYKVKVGLPTENGPEHIWVGDLRFEDGELVGSLANEPMFLPEMHLGSRVVVREEQVSDWSVFREDRLYGSFTTRVMLPELEEEQAARLRDVLSTAPLPPDWSS
jgi:uncharacterized protein YegJ (DUF2314 family)